LIYQHVRFPFCVRFRCSALTGASSVRRRHCELERPSLLARAPSWPAAPSPSEYRAGSGPSHAHQQARSLTDAKTRNIFTIRATIRAQTFVCRVRWRVSVSGILPFSPHLHVVARIRTGCAKDGSVWQGSIVVLHGGNPVGTPQFGPLLIVTRAWRGSWMTEVPTGFLTTTGCRFSVRWTSTCSDVIKAEASACCVYSTCKGQWLTLL